MHQSGIGTNSCTNQTGFEIKLSPGDHSNLIKKIVDDFSSSIRSGKHIVYVGDTGIMGLF
jgi:hypothetical protein